MTTVAGDGAADVIVKGLAIRSPDDLDVGAFSAALDAADLVVVENMASLPLNVAATEALDELLDDRPAIFRHHDLAWQRPEGVNSPSSARSPAVAPRHDQRTLSARVGRARRRGDHDL